MLMASIGITSGNNAYQKQLKNNNLSILVIEELNN